MPSCCTAEEDDRDYILIHGLFYDFDQGPDVGVHGVWCCVRRFHADVKSILVFIFQ